MAMATAAMVGLAPVMSNYPIVAVSPVSLLLQRRRVGRRMTGTIWEHRGRHLAGDGNYLIGGAEAFLLICRLTLERSICPVWISLCAFYLIFLGLGFWLFECHMLLPTSCFFIIFPGSILCVVSHTSIFSLWGPPLCETNTNTMSWSWGKVIKQLSISWESIDNHLTESINR